MDHVYSRVYGFVNCVAYLWLATHDILNVIICESGNTDMYIYIHTYIYIYIYIYIYKYLTLNFYWQTFALSNLPSSKVHRPRLRLWEVAAGNETQAPPVLVSSYEGHDKMAAILLMTFSHSFSHINNLISWFKIHWNIFPKIRLTTSQPVACLVCGGRQISISFGNTTYNIIDVFIDGVLNKMDTELTFKRNPFTRLGEANPEVNTKDHGILRV